MIFPATEVGKPEGPRVTKDIGPAGGSIASPDGRLTLTVPQNALTETVAFSIQPITNKAGGGLGLAYRLEPDGKTFTTPLEISVRYDEKDLKGTVPEALALAYQDKERAWHAQKSAKLDQAAKTLTISTTHFTDEAFLARLQISPADATIYVGDELPIHFVECKEPDFWDHLLSRPLDCSEIPKAKEAWKLRGLGRLSYEQVSGVLYTAPAKKPTPNVAWVDLTASLYLWNSTTGQTSAVQKPFSARITILDRGYMASGNTADVVWSGVICSLEKPFTVSGSIMNYKINFKPSSPTGGTATYAGAGFGATGEGGGKYTIEGTDTDKPQIVFPQTGVGRSDAGTVTGGGTVYINLTPLKTDQCTKK